MRFSSPSLWTIRKTGNQDIGHMENPKAFVPLSVDTLVNCYRLSSDPISDGSLKPVGTGGDGIPSMGYFPVVTKL